MRFVYDPLKNARNVEKHKVSFEDVLGIWDDPDLIVLPARKRGEKRFLAIGQSYALVFAVIYTMRGKAIRVISARRANAKEVAYYEKNRSSR